MGDSLQWFKAAKRGDLEFIKQNFQMMKGQKNKQEMTALMCAAKYGRLDVVTFLLEAESRIVTNTTALLLAVQAQNYSVAKCLAPLEYDLTTSDGRTALMLAASDCDTVFVTMLLAYLGNENDVYWKTALEYAILGSKQRNLQILIESDKFTPKQIQTAYYYSLTVTNDVEMRSYLKTEAGSRGAPVSQTNSASVSLSASINDECVEMINNDLDRMIAVNREQEQTIQKLQEKIAYFEEQEDKLKSTIADEYARQQTTDCALGSIFRQIQLELSKLPYTIIPTSIASPEDLVKVITVLVERSAARSIAWDLVVDELKKVRESVRQTQLELKRYSDAMSESFREGTNLFAQLQRNMLGTRSDKDRLNMEYEQKIKSLEAALDLARKTIDELRTGGMPGAQKSTCDKEIYVWFPIQQRQLARPSIEPIVTSLMQSVRSISSRTSRNRNTTPHKPQQMQALGAPSTWEVDQKSFRTARAIAPTGRSSLSGEKEQQEASTHSPHFIVASRVQTQSPISPQDIALRASVEHVPALTHELSASSVLASNASPRQSVGSSSRQQLLVDDNGVTTLMEAAKNGDVAGVKAAMSQLKCYNNEGFTALMILAQQSPITKGHIDVLKILAPLEGGMSVQSGKQAGATALMLALEAKNFSVAEGLLDIEAGHQRDNGITALILATFHNNEGIATRLIEAEGKLLKQGIQTPLMNAASHGNIGLVRKFLFQAKRVKQGGWTALMMAAQKGHASIVELLEPYEAGMQKDDGTTALLLAANSGFLEAARILAPKEAGLFHLKGHSALLLAARSNYHEIVKLLLSKEAGIPARNTVTALMYASQKGHVETVQLLLDYEAGKMSEDQWTALMYAALNNQSEVVRLLAPKEAGMRRDRYTGATAMIIAAEHGAAESVAVLADYEAKCVDKVGCTALMVAAQRGQTAVVRILCDKESGMQTPEGITALMLAIQYSHRDCIEILYKQECNLRATDGSSCTHYCVSTDDFQFVQSLAQSS